VLAQVYRLSTPLATLTLLNSQPQKNATKSSTSQDPMPTPKPIETVSVKQIAFWNTTCLINILLKPSIDRLPVADLEMF